MSEILKEVLLANSSYWAAFGGKGKLALPPVRRFAILTCMDARLDPAKSLGSGKVMRTSSGTPAVVQVKTPSVHL